MNGPICPRRRFTLLRIDLEDVKLVREAFGVTINDVVMNMAAEAVRDYLLARQDLPAQPLTASVPISTRERGAVHSYGNKVGSLCVSLCTDAADPVERLRAIHAASQASKLEFEDTAGGRMADVVGVLPPVAVRLLGRYSRARSLRGESPAANVIVSNVAGPRGELYDDYLPLREFYSIGPILEGVGLNITAWSFRDKLSFAVLSCPRAVPEPECIAEKLVAALATMKRAASA